MRKQLFFLVLFFQSAWLLGLVAVQEHALAAGRVILLETVRVDPRDLLRGDYLILNYKISDVPVNLFSPPAKSDLAIGTPIYVALTPGTNGFYNVTRASTNEFVPVVGEVLLRGSSTWPSWNAGSNSIHAQYGLERFYVAEGTGNPTGKLTAQVVVPASGRGCLKEILVDGKPYAEAMKDAVR